MEASPLFNIDAISEILATKSDEELQQLYDDVYRDFQKHATANLLLYFNTGKALYDGRILRPNPIQEELLDAWTDWDYKVFTYTGANRIGKTTLLVILAFSVMHGKFPWSNKRLYFPHNEPRKIRIVGQDWQKHIKTVLIPAMRKWWPQEWGNLKDVIRRDNQGVEAMWTCQKTKSTCEIMSNMQESDLHEGWDGDLILYDEPPKRKIRVANARGLIDREGREFFGMTLLKEAWVDHDVIKARNEDGTPDRTVYSIDGDISVNIGYGITQKGVDQFAKTLTEDEIEARIKGKPSYLSGMVCKKFSRKKHLKSRFKIPLDWIVDIGIDIHPRKEQAILFMATSPKQERWLFRELFKHGSGTDVGEWIIRIIKANVLRVGKIICDPLAKGDSNNPNTTFDKIDIVLGRYGYVLNTGTKDKESGIIQINEHLEGPNLEPSLFVLDDMVRTIYEFESWMYEDAEKYPDRAGKAQKQNDDMMENLYRLLLEDTVWYPMEEGEDEFEDADASGACAVTGY